MKESIFKKGDLERYLPFKVAAPSGRLVLQPGEPKAIAGLLASAMLPRDANVANPTVTFTIKRNGTAVQTAPTVKRKITPTRVLFYDKSAGVYIDITSVCTDGDGNTNTGTTLDGMTTNDAIYVCCDEPFGGLVVDVADANDQNAALQVKYRTSSGWAATAWSKSGGTLVDHTQDTTNGDTTLAQDGDVWWWGGDHGGIPNDWVLYTLEGTNGYWVQVTADSDLGNDVSLAGLLALRAPGVLYHAALEDVSVNFRSGDLVTMDVTFSSGYQVGQFPPQSVYFYDASETSYSDEFADVTDGASATKTPQFGQAADYLYIGCFKPFIGVYVEVADAAGTSGALKAEYYNGASWVSLSNIVDGTLSGSDTLKQDGSVYWPLPADWAKYKHSNLGNHELYWVRLAVSQDNANPTIANLQTLHLAETAGALLVANAPQI